VVAAAETPPTLPRTPRGWCVAAKALWAVARAAPKDHPPPNRPLVDSSPARAMEWFLASPATHYPSVDGFRRPFVAAAAGVPSTALAPSATATATAAAKAEVAASADLHRSTQKATVIGYQQIPHRESTPSQLPPN